MKIFILSILVAVLFGNQTGAEALTSEDSADVADLQVKLSELDKVPREKRVSEFIAISSLIQKVPASEAKLKLLFQCIEVAASLEIKGLDHSNPPVLRVRPPKGSGVDGGVLPSEIKDPALRAEYEAAIAANRLKSKVFTEQRELELQKRSLINSVKMVPLNNPYVREGGIYLDLLEASRIDAETKRILREFIK